MELMRLPDGRKIELEGNEITGEDALYIAKTLFDGFGLQGKRISRHLMYEIEPAIFSECPHTEDIPDAIEMAELEEEMAKEHPRWDKR